MNNGFLKRKKHQKYIFNDFQKKKKKIYTTKEYTFKRKQLWGPNSILNKIMGRCKFPTFYSFTIAIMLNRSDVKFFYLNIFLDFGRRVLLYF